MKSKLILDMRNDYIFVVLINCLIWKHRQILPNFVVEGVTPLPYIREVLS